MLNSILKRHYTPAQAASKLGVAPSTVYAYIDRGHLQAQRIGPGKKGRLIITREELKRFMKEYREIE